MRRRVSLRWKAFKCIEEKEVFLSMRGIAEMGIRAKQLLVIALIGITFGIVSSSLEDIVFPPPFIKSNDDTLPPGHMKPLGWQRPPEGPVKEYDGILSTQDYWDKHVKSRTPCIFRGAIKQSPALKNWNDDEYLKSKYGDLDVLVELKKENRTFSTGRLRYSEFLSRYKKDDLYVVTMLPKAMMHEVQAVNSVLCGTFKNFTHESNFWMSNGGTRSVIHYDADHNLHCMIVGRKDLIMVRNTLQNRKWLYMSSKPATAGSGFSPLSPDIIDMNKYPDYAKVPWHYATIYPGDCVYIPAVYIHQVRAYGRSLSVTTLFTEEIIGDQKHFTSEGCTDELLKEYRTMADIDFHWTYEKGDATIDMGYMNVERLRHIFVKHMNESRKTVWNFKDFKRFFLEFSHGEAQMSAEEAWQKVLGHKMKDKVYKDTVHTYTRDQLKRFARSLDPPHGPKTNGLEKVTVLPGSDKDKNDRERKDERDREEDDDDEYQNEDGNDNEDDNENEDDDDEDNDRRGAYSPPDLVYDDERGNTETIEHTPRDNSRSDESADEPRSDSAANHEEL